MSKELEKLEKLSLEEKWDNFLEFVDVPSKARLLDCDCKEGLEQYRYLRTEIETAIKNYLKILPEYEDTTKKLKALEIIKEKNVDVSYIMENSKEKDVIWYNSRFMGVLCEGWRMLTQEEYNLLKEVLFDGK